MTDNVPKLNAKQLQSINDFRQKNPEYVCASNSEIVSIMKETSIETGTVYSGFEALSANNKSTTHKTTEKKVNSVLRSDHLNNVGETFEHSKEQVKTKQQPKSIDISTKTQQALTAGLQNKCRSLEVKLKQTKEQNGFIGSSWDWVKNTTGLGDGSGKVQAELTSMKKQLKTLDKNPAKINEVYKNLTGKKLTTDELQNFTKGKTKLKAEQKINDYQQGQEMAADVTADIVSGVATVGIYTTAVAAAPFTGGASIAVGIVAAAASGAAIKSGMKYADAKSGGRNYNSIGHDMATGAFSGVLAPVTGGMGGAIGKTVATKFGIQAVKSVGTEVAETTVKEVGMTVGAELASETVEETVKTGLKESVKTMLLNPTGYKYVGGSTIKRALTSGAEMATSGAAGGTVDNSFRAVIEGKNVANAAVEGFAGGLIAAPLIGAGFKLVGKAGSKIGGKVPEEIPETKIGEVAESFVQEKVKNKAIETIKRDKPEIKYPEAYYEVNELHNKLAASKDAIMSEIELLGVQSSRVKSTASLYDKVSSKLDKGKTLPEAFEEIQDGLGTRTFMPDLDLKEHSEILELYKTNPNEAVKQAAELHSKQSVQKLEAMIDKQVQDGNLEMVAIDNYRGPDGIPYLSDNQVEHIQNYALDKNVRFYVNSGSVKEATRKSGYTALQVNFKSKNGVVFEWQTRGLAVNDFAELEHSLYDLRQGKDLTGGRPELKKVYEPFINAVKNLTEADYKEYSGFLNQNYLYLRKKELGFPVSPPTLDKKFDPLLSVEGLKTLHDAVEIAKKQK